MNCMNVFEHVQGNNSHLVSQFQSRFPTEESCERMLLHARWPNGFRCPRCHCSQAYEISTRRLWACARCKYQTSLTSGTILENTRTSLKKWFLAFYLMAHTPGINAVKLKAVLQVTYKTAWSLMTKIRYALKEANDETLLSGTVRYNAAKYGKKLHADLKNLIAGEHHVIIGGSMDADGQPVHIKIKRNPAQFIFKGELLREGMTHFAKNHVDPMSTDARGEYKRYSRTRFRSLLKIVKLATAWVHQTYGGIGSKHLQTYLDEYSFRYNNQYKGHLLFDRLLNICTSHSNRTLEQLV